MLISLVLILLLTLGGLGITYLIDREESLMWRLAVGNVAGSCIFGLLAFVGADVAAGLTTALVVGALVVTLLPTLLFLRTDIRASLRRDMERSGDRVRNANGAKLTSFCYYVFFFALFA